MNMIKKPSTNEMRRARLARDGSYDGIFWVGVRTMKIFCRPSCPAKQPLEKNVAYFTSLVEAMQSSFRPCKRCLPTETTGRPPEWIKTLLKLSDDNISKRLTDVDLRDRGINPVRARRYFLKHYGLTFSAYHRARRMGDALVRIKQGGDILDTAFDEGYESASGFQDAFRRQFGTTPGQGRTVKQILVHSVESPIGKIQIGATEQGICLLEFSDRRALPTEMALLQKHFRCPIVPGTNEHIDQLAEELRHYFERELTRFKVPLDITGTPFERSVWSELSIIPYGKTASYGEVARKIRRPGAQRAVGRANGANKIAIIIPCHRVIQGDGTLRGYGGGLWRKQFLLDLESDKSIHSVNGTSNQKNSHLECLVSPQKETAVL